MPTKRANKPTPREPAQMLFELDALVPELMKLLRDAFFEVPRYDLENDEYEYVSLHRERALALARYIDFPR